MKREKDLFKVSGMILLAAVFEFNVILVTLVIPDYFPDLVNESAIYQARYYIIGLCMLVFLSLLYIRYFKITNYEDVYSKLQNMTDRKKAVHHLLSVFYILGSFIAVIAYAIVSGPSLD